ncbi:MAG: transposase zinc-binding domain-containing protein [Holophagaceae bacterium]|nr:transposase zinc-binding domain-containing protein [Holophagaceae bacterium]
MYPTHTYEPRCSDQTILRRCVSRYWPRVRDTCEAHGRPLPSFVNREFDTYLRSGDLKEGFARAHCATCGHDRLVPFSCKGRGFCPSCGGRRMHEGATWLCERVLPAVPLRHERPPGEAPGSRGVEGGDPSLGGEGVGRRGAEPTSYLDSVTKIPTAGWKVRTATPIIEGWGKFR